MHRRIIFIVLVFFAGATFFAGFLLFGSSLSFPAYLPLSKTSDVINATESASSVAASDKVLNVAIAETNGWHDEVVAALAHSFGSQPNVQLSLYQANSRFGMSNITAAFQLPHKMPAFQSPDRFSDDRTAPDIVVLTTCELDSNNLRRRLSELLAEGRTYLFCVVHHGDQWNDAKRKEVIAPWMDLGLVDFVTLSPHTATFLKANGLKDWSTKGPSIKSFAPLFPIPPPSPNRKGVIDKQRELAFAIQGNYEPSRRDFDTIFSHLRSFVDASNSRTDEERGANVTLHLLGSGNKPPVPEGLSNHVFFDEDLSYEEYYTVLSNTFAILPAFADNEYLDRKASSTVPASLLGGTPLVATEEILAAYSYLPKEAVYCQKEGETELAAIGRILLLKAKERKDKMTSVRKTCAEIIEGNVELIGAWIKEAETRLDH